MQYGEDSMYILQWLLIHIGNFSRVQRKKTDVDYSVGIPITKSILQLLPVISFTAKNVNLPLLSH